MIKAAVMTGPGTTRNIPDIKMGASVRAAIDMVDLYAGMQKIEESAGIQFSASPRRMAISNKIWLNEMTDKTAEGIIRELWDGTEEETGLSPGGGSEQSVHSAHTPPVARGEDEAKKKSDVTGADRIAGAPFFNFDTNDPSDYLAHGLPFQPTPRKTWTIFLRGPDRCRLLPGCCPG